MQALLILEDGFDETYCSRTFTWCASIGATVSCYWEHGVKCVTLAAGVLHKREDHYHCHCLKWHVDWRCCQQTPTNGIAISHSIFVISNKAVTWVKKYWKDAVVQRVAGCWIRRGSPRISYYAHHRDFFLLASQPGLNPVCKSLKILHRLDDHKQLLENQWARSTSSSLQVGYKPSNPASSRKIQKSSDKGTGIRWPRKCHSVNEQGEWRWLVSAIESPILQSAGTQLNGIHLQRS